jgi:tetratricopeptide (TPR) repeat protein
MAALPRPELPAGPHRDLVEALHELHHRAGWPSLRVMGRAAGCSPTTVSAAFSSTKLPSWGLLELIVESLQGDAARFHRLWLEAGSAAPAGRTAPVVGRSAEVAAVRRHLETGTGLLVVTGEAGMGKSHVLAAAVPAANARTARGACLPLSHAAPLMPIADALDAAWSADGGRWVTTTLASLPPHLPTSLGALLPALAGGDAVRADREQLFVALARLLEGPADGPRLALVLDDLHWADPETLDLLEHLLARSAPAAVVGTWRLQDDSIGEAAQEWWVRVRRLPGTAVLPLRPLDRDETAEQIAQLGLPAGRELVDRVFRRSQGLPLFTEQLAAEPESTDELPALLGDLLERRLGALDGPATAVAGCLAVADRPMAAEDIAELTGLSDTALDTALHALAQRYLLAAHATDVSLRHPLLAEAGRNRLLPHERQRWHRRLAETLGRSPSASPAEVAEHWRGAGDAAHELVWRERAASAAEARASMSQAAAAWLRVLELCAADGAEDLVTEARSLGEAMRCLTASGGLDRAGGLTERALAIVDHLPPGPAAALLTAVGGVLGGLVGPSEAIPLLERALTLHERLPASRDQVRTLGQLTGQLRGMGRLDEAREVLARAVDVSERIGDDHLLRHNLEIQGWHEVMAGEPAAAAATWARAATVEMAEVDRIWISVVRTDALLVGGAPAEEVEAAAADALEMACEREISSHAVALLQGNVARALTDAGRVDSAWRLVEPATRGHPAVDTWPVFIERMWLEALRGDGDRAAEQVDRVAAVPITAVTNQAERALRAADVALWRGDAQRAHRLVTEALRGIAGGPGSLRAAGLLTRLAHAAGDLADRHPDPAAAESLVEVRRSLSHDPLDDAGVTADRFAARSQWDAELGRLLGRSDPAVWAAAAGRWDALSRPHHAAYCRWRGAQAALAAGHGTAARRLLRRAALDARTHVPLTRALRATEMAPA